MITKKMKIVILIVILLVVTFSLGIVPLNTLGDGIVTYGGEREINLPYLIMGLIGALVLGLILFRRKII